MVGSKLEGFNLRLEHVKLKLEDFQTIALIRSAYPTLTWYTTLKTEVLEALALEYTLVQTDRLGLLKFTEDSRYFQLHFKDIHAASNYHADLINRYDVCQNAKIVSYVKPHSENSQWREAYLAALSYKFIIGYKYLGDRPAYFDRDFYIAAAVAVRLKVETNLNAPSEALWLILNC